MRSFLPYLILFLGFLSFGCGRLGDPGGGSENLPNRGVVPYELIAEDDGGDPRVLESATLLFRSPHALVDGARVLLFVEARDPDTGLSTIHRAISLDGGVRFGEPELVLEAPDTLEWTGGSVGSPSLHCTGTSCLMVVSSPGGFGLADGSLDGSFSLRAEPIYSAQHALELGGLYAPSLVALSDGFALFYEGSDVEDGSSRIFRTVAGSDLVFVAGEPVLAPGSDCLDLNGGEEACWDAEGVGSPEIRRATNEMGDIVFRMFYTGRAPGSTGIGFAASFDGLSWQRFDANPVLISDATITDPSNILIDDRYMLYFLHHRSGTQHGIGLAVNESGLPSEHF
jgi:hypothetical protein